MKGIAENGQIIQELEVKSYEKGETKSKLEIIEVKKQLIEKNNTKGVSQHQ